MQAVCISEAEPNLVPVFGLGCRDEGLLAKQTLDDIVPSLFFDIESSDSSQRWQVLWIDVQNLSVGVARSAGFAEFGSLHIRNLAQLIDEVGLGGPAIGEDVDLISQHRNPSVSVLAKIVERL